MKFGISSGFGIFGIFENNLTRFRGLGVLFGIWSGMRRTSEDGKDEKLRTYSDLKDFLTVTVIGKVSWQRRSLES